MQERVPRGVLTELKRFFYDTAWSAHPMALASLTKLVPASQIVFGSDYPYRTGEDHVKGLAEYGFTAADRRAIERENALRLLPRLQCGAPACSRTSEAARDRMRIAELNSIPDIYLQARDASDKISSAPDCGHPRNRGAPHLQFGPLSVLPRSSECRRAQSRQAGPFVVCSRCLVLAGKLPRTRLFWMGTGVLLVVLAIWRRGSRSSGTAQLQPTPCSVLRLPDRRRGRAHQGGRHRRRHADL